MASTVLQNEDTTMGTSNATPTDSTNVAVQLIEFNREENSDKSTIKLNDELFKSLVTQAGDRPVSVICICGPSRQGKSFLLGYMVRCLEALEKDDSDWMDWDNRSKPLKGFKFENGENPVTQGIWVWNRPFVVKNDEDKEVAVLLVDTQGTNDEFTTTKDMAAIVGLSLLLSSVTIFNFFTNLQEDILAALNMFIQYGLVAMENAEGAPFQKLMFLIRDWNMPGSHRYGDEGGKTFIESKLKVKLGQPPEVVQVREMIRKCFEDVDCFLMPHIGEKAIANENFTGSIGELAPLFAKKMEEFISNLISSETLTLKRVLGNPVSMPELKAFLDMYIQVFNSNDVPSANNMWEATSDAHLITLVTKSQKKFTEFMKKRQRGSSYLSEDELDSALSRAEKQAIQLFQEEKKFTGKDKADQYQQELVQILERAKTEIKNKNEEKRQSFIAGAINDATTQFRSLIEEAVGFNASDPFHFHEESDIKNAAKPSLCTVIEDFKDKLTNESDECVKYKEQTVRSILTSSLDTHIRKNSLRRAAAEGEMQKIVELTTAAYHEQLAKIYLEKQFSDICKFADLLESIKESCIQSFEDRKKLGSSSFQKPYRTQLEQKMDEAYSNLKNSHKLRLQELQSKVDTLIGEACDLYSEFLQEQMKILETKEEIEHIHISRIDKTMQSFKNGGNPYPEGHEMYLASCKKLRNNLEGVYKKALKEAVKAKKRVEDSYRDAVAKAVDHYTSKMKEITDSYDFIEQEALQVEHEQVVKEALKFYDGIEKLGVLKNFSDFIQVLVNNCAKKFERITEEDQQKHEHAKLIAQNTVNECLNKYEEIIKESMSKSRSLEELDVCHQTAVAGAKKLFMQKCPGKNNPDFIQEYEQQLEEAISETFDDLKEIFEIRLKVEGAATKSLLVDCTNFYHNQMKTHVQNEMFLMPQTLLQHHTSAMNSVLQKFDRQQPLTQNQKMDLKMTMGTLFHKYRMENDMKLNYRTKGEPPAIGIDLGTTYCCVGVYVNGEVIIIPNQKQGGQLTTPSFVAYEQDGSVTVGAPAKENAFRNPENTIFDAKRIIGRPMSDENLNSDMVCWPFTVVSDKGVPKIKLSSGRLLYPEEISAELLKECREIVEDYLKLPRNTIKKAVITVPAYFEDGQKQATVSAGRLAGLEVLTILNEPTAAAIAYSQKRLDAEARKVLIFDMGGGTFDVAVLDMKAGEIEVLGVSGDTHLGGEDFDNNMMKFCAQKFKGKHGIDLLVGKDSTVKTEKDNATRTMRRLQMYCENSKKNLSTARTVEVTVDAITRSLDLNVNVNREIFEEINEKYFNKSIEIVEAALKKVGVSKESIDDIVLVGGSTRIPRIQELLTAFFGGKALNRSIHPDQAVAYGAAIKAAMLNGEQTRGDLGLDSLRIHDVAPFSLGIETSTMDLSVIIPKNSKIPTKRTKEYYTAYDDQTHVNVKIYQGEDLEIAANNKLLGKFVLGNIPRARKGQQPLDITMEINEMGILEVTAVIRSTKGSNKITIKESRQGMSKMEVDRILGEANSATSRRESARSTV